MITLPFISSLNNNMYNRNNCGLLIGWKGGMMGGCH